jgi:hypothetical protein
MKKKHFEVKTEYKIKKAYNYQKKNGWTFFNEREHTETILHSRFNFLLLAYSLFINAYFWVKDNNDYINDRLTILIIGLIIVFLLSIGIYKAYTRLMILFDILYNLNEYDIFPFVYNEYKKTTLNRIFPRNAIIGYIVPIIMILSLVIGIIYNIWKLKYFN